MPVLVRVGSDAPDTAGQQAPQPRGEIQEIRGARHLQDLLRHTIETAPEPVKTEAVPELRRAADRRQAFWRQPVFRRFYKTAIGLAVVAAVAVAPVQALLQTSSVEAVVNAPLITLRSPIEGKIDRKDTPSVGSAVVAGLTMFRIVNARTDRAKVDALRRQIGLLQDERPGFAARIAATEADIAMLAAQTEAFRIGRIAKLEAAKGVIDGDIAIARSKHEEAEAALARAARLAETGTVSAVAFDQARRDAAIAAATVSAAEFRRRELDVELASAKAGTYLGDGYNDRPSSAQRLDDSRQRLTDLQAEIASRDAQTAHLEAELTGELAHYNDLASAEVKAPVAGRIWEVLASPGEEVGRGRDLVRLVDCSGALVTASVSESVYNGLHAGMPAVFLPRGGTLEYRGTVVNLTGLAGAPSNFAIEPSALAKEPYRVTVAVPALAGGASCNVGRTGRVVFEQPEAQSAFSRLSALAQNILG